MTENKCQRITHNGQHNYVHVRLEIAFNLNYWITFPAYQILLYLTESCNKTAFIDNSIFVILSKYRPCRYTYKKVNFRSLNILHLSFKLLFFIWRGVSGRGGGTCLPKEGIAGSNTAKQYVKVCRRQELVKQSTRSLQPSEHSCKEIPKKGYTTIQLNRQCERNRLFKTVFYIPSSSSSSPFQQNCITISL